MLVDYLEAAYGPDQEVVNYVASMFTMAESTIARHRLADLRDPAVAKTVTGISTFFIGSTRATDSNADVAARFGFKAGKARTSPLITNREDYARLKKVAERNNLNHSVPSGYKYSYASRGLYQTLYDLALSPEAQAAFRADAKGFLESREELTPLERRFISTRHHGAIRMLFKRDPETEAQRFIGDALLKPYLADCYRAKQQVENAALDRGEITPSHYQGALADWLLQQGYATTSGMVTKAMRGVKVMGMENSGAAAPAAP
jgi:hypothetical protein